MNIAHPDIRASLVILPSTFITIGALLVWIFGSFLSWRMTAYLMIIPSLVLVLLLSRLPETPYWLIQDGNLGMARKSLQYFRGEKTRFKPSALKIRNQNLKEYFRMKIDYYQTIDIRSKNPIWDPDKIRKRNKIWISGLYLLFFWTWFQFWSQFLVHLA